MAKHMAFGDLTWIYGHIYFIELNITAINNSTHTNKGKSFITHR